MNERSLVTAFSPGASRVWQSRLNMPVEPAVTSTCSGGSPWCAASFSRSGLQSSSGYEFAVPSAFRHSIEGARRGSKRIFVGIESDQPRPALQRRRRRTGKGRCSQVAGRLGDDIKKTAHASPLIMTRKSSSPPWVYCRSCAGDRLPARSGRGIAPEEHRG